MPACRSKLDCSQAIRIVPLSLFREVKAYVEKSKLHDMLNSRPAQRADVGLLLHKLSTLAAHGDVAAGGAAGLLGLSEAHDAFTLVLKICT